MIQYKAAITQTLAETLAQAREGRSLSTAAAADRLKITEEKVIAFERGDYAVLPDDVYTRIALKAYAALLGLDPSKIIKLYSRERDIVRNASPTADRPWTRHPADAVPPGQLAVVPRIMRIAFAGAVVLTLGIYLSFEIKSLVTPPSVVLNSPDDGVVTVARSITVEGRTEPEATVVVSGKAITPDVDGRFSDTLELQEGSNIITVTAKKKHSRDMTLTRRVFVEPTERPAAVMPSENLQP